MLLFEQFLLDFKIKIRRLLSVSPSFYLSISVPTYPPIYLFICLTVYLLTHQLPLLSVSLPAFHSVYLYLFLLISILIISTVLLFRKQNFQNLFVFF